MSDLERQILHHLHHNWYTSPEKRGEASFYELYHTLVDKLREERYPGVRQRLKEYES